MLSRSSELLLPLSISFTLDDGGLSFSQKLTSEFLLVLVCVCIIIPFILDVSLVDVPAGVTQEEGRT